MSNSIQVYRPQPFIGVQTESPRQRNHARHAAWLRNRFLASQAWLLLLAFILLVSKATLAVIEFYPLAYLIDYLTGYRLDLITFLGLPILASPFIMTSAVLTGILVLLILLHSLADTLANVCLTRCGHLLSYKVRFAIFSHLNQQARTAHDQRQIDDILTRFIGDVSSLEDFVIRSCTDIVGNFLLLAGTLTFLAYYSGEIALLGLIIIFATTLLSWHFTHDLQAKVQKQQGHEDDLVSATQEMLTPLLAIQPYNRENYEQQRFAEYNRKNFDAARRTATRQAQFSWLSKVIEAVAIMAVLWLGVRLFNQTNITIGTLVLMVVLSYNMIKPTREIVAGWSAVNPARSSLDRISELLDNAIIFTNEPPAPSTPQLRGFLEAPTAPVVELPAAVEDNQTPATENYQMPPSMHLDIKQLNLCLHAGEALAIIHSPQTNSNMMADLLTNLSATHDGRLWIGRREGGSGSQPIMLPPLHIMLQEPILLDGSVADNIAYGCTETTHEQIIKAAEQANAHAFITQWPAGYDTLLGEQGETLSSSQHQSIAIARAILHNAPILILEEPTGRLDTEEWMMSALRILMQGKTTIILSQDQALINLTDRAVKVRNGVWEEIATTKTSTQHPPLNGTPPLGPTITIDKVNKPNGAQADPTTFTLRGNRILQQKLPALTIALDADTMRGRLQTTLVGLARGRHYTIDRCTPGQPAYHNDGCTVQYELEIQDHTTGRALTQLVLGRLFSNPHTTENYLRQHLTPLATLMAGHPESAPFMTPCVQLDGLNMVIQVFPMDGELPALVTLTDDQRMIDFFHATLPEAADKRFLIETCTIDILQYEAHQRCLLQYQLDGRLTSAKKAGRQILYGQITADERGELISPVLLALRRRMAADNRTYRFNLPHLLNYHAGLRLALFETIPGTPTLPGLLAKRLAWEDHLHPAGLTLENALDASARIVSVLHTANIMLGQPYLLEDELTELQKQIQAVWPLSPTLAMCLQENLQQIQIYARQSEPLPLCFSHGAFTPLQPLFDRAASGLLNFDTVCQAEPARDLGQFLAHFQWLAIETQSDPLPADPEVAESISVVNQLCFQFLQTYLIELGYTPHRAEHLHVRVKIYEAIHFMHLTLNQWQDFQDGQLKQLVSLMEEKVIALPKMQNYQDLVRKAPLHWLNGASPRKQQAWR